MVNSDRNPVAVCAVVFLTSQSIHWTDIRVLLVFTPGLVFTLGAVSSDIPAFDISRSLAQRLLGRNF